VAITIRNKTTEELIRKIGRRTGEGPSAVVRRLAEREAGINKGSDAVSPETVERRMRELEESRLRHSYPDDPKLSWPEIEKEMDSIFGDGFAPRQARR
jgi:hypothetical protein